MYLVRGINITARVPPIYKLDRLMTRSVSRFFFHPLYKLFLNRPRAHARLDCYTIYCYIYKYKRTCVVVARCKNILYTSNRLDDCNQTTTEADDVDCDIIITIYEV